MMINKNNDEESFLSLKIASKDIFLFNYKFRIITWKGKEPEHKYSLEYVYSGVCSVED